MIFIIKADLVSGVHMPDADVSRTIRIGGSHTLDDLCGVLLDSIAFDHDHLYMFSLGEQAFGSDDSKIYSRQPAAGEHSTKEKLYRLSLREGSRFWLDYDFGDDWTFSLTVEKALDESGNIKPSVIESTGTVEQYPDPSLLESPEKGAEADAAGLSSEKGAEADAAGLALEGIEGIGGDDQDVSDEYFDADESRTKDSNPVLGRIMVRVVERQIASGKPAFVKEAYGQLQEKGYIRKAAKIRLATALSNEVFEILEYNKNHDENRYRGFVQNLLAEPFDPDMIPDLETGKEHLISEGLSEFNQRFMDNDAEGAADKFSELWPEIREWIDHNYTRMAGGKLLRFSVDAIDESMDYRMNLYNSIMDSGMAYINARRYEEGVKIEKEILDTFSWENGMDAEVRDYIGTMLNDMGKTGEADQWFQDWYALSPDNPDCTNSYVFALQQRGDENKAREVLEAHLPAHPEPDRKYLNLYTRAADLYHQQGDQQKSDFYQDLVDQITRSAGTRSAGDIAPVQFGGAWDDGMDPFHAYVPAQPVKKSKKIYPNDPCPCGSGKKYKNCCGRNKK